MTCRLMTAAVAVGLAAVLAACGGGTMQTEEAAPAGQATAVNADAIVADLVAEWREQKETMLAIADAMPEERFGYRATPAQRTYGEQIMHVATVNVKLVSLVGGQAAAPSFTAESATTKAQILEALGQSYDYGIAVLNEQTGATITQVQDAAFMGQATRARIFWRLLAHSMDIYGQMAVYLRLNDIVPPASRGV
jgi:uncharacterized damage-inducible protein DinB